MELTTEVKGLKLALALTKAGVSARGSLPVLCGAHLRADDLGLTLTTTDLDLTMMTTIPAVVSTHGVTVLPHKLLSDVISKSKATGTTIGCDEDEAQVRSGFIAKMRMLPVGEYPKLPMRPTGEHLPFDLEALASVLPAASTEDSRPILTGILIGGNGETGTEMAATDSYRLHVAHTDIALPRTLIPSRAIATLLKVAKDKKVLHPATIGFDEHYVWIECNGVTIVSRLIEGEFPNYRQLIPSSYPNSFTVKEAALLDAIDTVSIYKRDTTTPVRVQVGDGQVVLRIVTQELGEIESEPIKAQVEGPEGTFAVNPVYFAQSVKQGGDETTISWVDSLKPVLVRRPDATERAMRLLMPVRVQ